MATHQKTERDGSSQRQSSAFGVPLPVASVASPAPSTSVQPSVDDEIAKIEEALRTAGYSGDKLREILDLVKTNPGLIPQVRLNLLMQSHSPLASARGQASSPRSAATGVSTSLETFTTVTAPASGLEITGDNPLLTDDGPVHLPDPKLEKEYVGLSHNEVITLNDPLFRIFVKLEPYIIGNENAMFLNPLDAKTFFRQHKAEILTRNPRTSRDSNSWSEWAAKVAEGTADQVGGPMIGMLKETAFGFGAGSTAVETDYLTDSAARDVAAGLKSSEKVLRGLAQFFFPTKSKRKQALEGLSAAPRGGTSSVAASSASAASSQMAATTAASSSATSAGGSATSSISGLAGQAAQAHQEPAGKWEERMQGLKMATDGLKGWASSIPYASTVIGYIHRGLVQAGVARENSEAQKREMETGRHEEIRELTDEEKKKISTFDTRMSRLSSGARLAGDTAGVLGGVSRIAESSVGLYRHGKQRDRSKQAAADILESVISRLPEDQGGRQLKTIADALRAGKDKIPGLKQSDTIQGLPIEDAIKLVAAVQSMSPFKSQLRSALIVYKSVSVQNFQRNRSRLGIAEGVVSTVTSAISGTRWGLNIAQPGRREYQLAGSDETRVYDPFGASGTSSFMGLGAAVFSMVGNLTLTAVRKKWLDKKQQEAESSAMDQAGQIFKVLTEIHNQETSLTLKDLYEHFDESKTLGDNVIKTRLEAIHNHVALYDAMNGMGTNMPGTLSAVYNFVSAAHEQRPADDEFDFKTDTKEEKQNNCKVDFFREAVGIATS